MITNPGGQLAPKEILGRDELIEKLWEILDGRCVYMNDLRRIGKTQIMVKNARGAGNGMGVRKNETLVEATPQKNSFGKAFSDSSAALTGGRQAMRRMTDLLGEAAGTEIAGILKLPDGSDAPWKEVLERTFRDIHESAEQKNQRMIFLWDEVPFLIDNIAKRQGTKTAMEVLDAIRSLTQDFDRVRVLLTGSIGLHHVLQTLKKDGYSGSPLNRMELVRPGPLSPEHATQLAKELLQGDGIQVDDLEKCAASIAASVGNVPFYVHKLISRLDASKPSTPSTIANVSRR